MIQLDTPEPAAVATDRADHVRGRVQEEFHSLLRSIPWPNVDSEAGALQALGFTSCLPQEGVSTFVLQTALAAAASGQHKIVVVDGNFYTPSLHTRLKIDREPGLAEVISGAALPVQTIQTTSFDNLSALPAGQANNSPATIFGAVDRLRDCVTALRAEFDLVIFDLPPVGKSDAAMPLLAMLDAVILVVEFERVQWELARHAVQRLNRAHVRLAGTVINKQREHVPGWLARML